MMPQQPIPADVQAAAHVLAWLGQHIGGMIGTIGAGIGILWGLQQRRRRIIETAESRARELGELTAAITDLRGDMAGMTNRVGAVEICFREELAARLKDERAQWSEFLTQQLEGLRRDFHEMAEATTTTVKEVRTELSMQITRLGGEVETIGVDLGNLKKIVDDLIESHGSRLMILERAAKGEA